MKRHAMVVLSALVVWCLVAAPARSSSAIDSISVTATPAHEPSQLLRVKLIGAPGGHATFDVASHLGIPMFEGPRGVYRGIYAASVYDSYENDVVVGHLATPDGRRSTLSSPDVAIGGLCLIPGPVSHTPTIYAAMNNGDFGLSAGQTLQVVVAGVPECNGTFDVGSYRGLPMKEFFPGQYMGSVTIRPGDHALGLVKVHLGTPDGEVASLIAPSSAALNDIP